MLFAFSIQYQASLTWRDNRSKCRVCRSWRNGVCFRLGTLHSPGLVLSLSLAYIVISIWTLKCTCVRWCLCDVQCSTSLTWRALVSCRVCGSRHPALGINAYRYSRHSRHRYSRQLTGVLSYQNWAHGYQDFSEMCGTHCSALWTAYRACTDSTISKSRVANHQGMDCRNVNDVNMHGMDGWG